MKKIGVYLPEDLNYRLKTYVLKKNRMFGKGQSEVVAEAIREYLDRHEPELEDH